MPWPRLYHAVIGMHLSWPAGMWRKNVLKRRRRWRRPCRGVERHARHASVVTAPWHCLGSRRDRACLAPAGHADTGPIRGAARRGALTASESPLRGEAPSIAKRGRGVLIHAQKCKMCTPALLMSWTEVIIIIILLPIIIIIIPMIIIIIIIIIIYHLIMITIMINVQRGIKMMTTETNINNNNT